MVKLSYVLPNSVWTEFDNRSQLFGPTLFFIYLFCLNLKRKKKNKI
jgi:hypothetical protein